MIKRSRIYYVFSYMFFVYPPFILGVVNIYWPNIDYQHVTSSLVNIFVVLVITGIVSMQIKTNRLHVPSRQEINYLLFGLLGNVIVFIYTFQYSLEIQNIVSVYILLLIILGFNYILITRKLIPKELWVILPVFAVFDYLVLALRGCGWEFLSYCNANTTYDSMLGILMNLIILFVVFYYAYRIMLYKLFDFFKIANIVLVLFLSYSAANDFFGGSELILTLTILYPFLIVVDFVIKIVNKRYSHLMLLFYIRTFLIFLLLSALGLFTYGGSFDFENELLSLLVVTTYFSLGISILKIILNIKIKEESPITAIKNIMQGPKFIEAKRFHIVRIQEQYNEKLASHVKIGPKAYSLIATIDDEIIGFISTYIKDLTPPLSDDEEAFISVIEVHTDYRNQGIATKLIQMTENHFKSIGVKQIRAWSSEDKYEAIHLWDKLKYTMSPTTITFKEGNIDVEGYFVTKRF